MIPGSMQFMLECPVNSGNFEPKNDGIVCTPGNFDPCHRKRADVRGFKFFGRSGKSEPVAGFPGNFPNQGIKISAGISQIKNRPVENLFQFDF